MARFPEDLRFENLDHLHHETSGSGTGMGLDIGSVWYAEPPARSMWRSRGWAHRISRCMPLTDEQRLTALRRCECRQRLARYWSIFVLQFGVGVWISRRIKTRRITSWRPQPRMLLATFSIFATWFGRSNDGRIVGSAYRDANACVSGAVRYGLCLIAGGLIFAVHVAPKVDDPGRPVSPAVFGARRTCGCRHPDSQLDSVGGGADRAFGMSARRARPRSK